MCAQNFETLIEYNSDEDTIFLEIWECFTDASGAENERLLFDFDSNRTKN